MPAFKTNRSVISVALCCLFPHTLTHIHTEQLYEPCRLFDSFLLSHSRCVYTCTKYSYVHVRSTRRYQHGKIICFSRHTETHAFDMLPQFIHGYFFSCSVGDFMFWQLIRNALLWVKIRIVCILPAPLFWTVGEKKKLPKKKHEKFCVFDLFILTHSNCQHQHHVAQGNAQKKCKQKSKIKPIQYSSSFLVYAFVGPHCWVFGTLHGFCNTFASTVAATMLPTTSHWQMWLSNIYINYTTLFYLFVHIDSFRHFFTDWILLVYFHFLRCIVILFNG